jgi:large subunit ribosomal protein L10
MPTPRKAEIVEEYSEKFKTSKSIFLADYSGINVAETTKLRRSFRDANVHYCVLKNTLAKLSLDKAGIEGMDEMLKGMTAFAFSDDDAAAPIRVINDFNKQKKKDESHLVVKGCVFEGRVFGADQADALSKLPSREVLLAQLVGVLKAPMTNLVNVLSGTGRNLVGTLESLKSQKS